ncbi:MAG: [protein-PII] uridylyltransferase [Gammaproteobacteria bacterium]|nr:[protein-PII] uridylyltransferase [Gammaproteobacteria bacterium]
MQLFFTGSFDRALSSSSTPLQLFRHTLQSVDEALAERFAKGVPVTELVRQRVWFMDELLVRAWHRFIPPRDGGIALVAVGGYGRHELHPDSDIDLLILLDPGAHSARRESLEKFLAFLWDIGLEVGHSVRTVAECVEEAGRDISVATNLMEARLLAGDDGLLQAMRAQTGPEHMWPTRAFFEAKWQEQLARHRKYHDTAYNLEPNVKEGPGGLRDIQTIAWVAKRHFRTDTLEGLVGRDFLTRREYDALIRGQEFLWKVRFALHLLTGRNENRLLFDYQRTLAAQFGYRDDQRLAVEHFMKDYYRTVTELSRLNEMLLQLFQEVILHADAPMEIVGINRRFRSCNGFIEVTDAGVFRHYPFALLEIFLLLEQHRELKGVRAATIRLIRDHRHLIDDRFRNDLRCRSLFMEILRQPNGVTHELRRMNRYGILAAYFPAFGAIVGQMQYDLFHVYTVDDHTLHVLRNLRRFTVPAYEQEFPLCSRIMKRIPKPELLYLGALFHDIAKGRGGDHSELGATDAFAFCHHHGLSDHDSHLVAWLVRHHLIMSSTAQHKDISDPDVVAGFARKVGDPVRLDYLYLLTVADIRGTNPTLWNSWKDALLIDLYGSTRHILGRGLDAPVNKEERIAETRTAALALLGETNAERVRAVWNELDEEYFLRHSPDEIAWQMRLILDSRPEDLPLIRVREETDRGGTEIFIYARDQDHLFAMTTSALDQLGLNILDARIITTRDGYTLDTYIVLDENGNAIHDPRGVREIADAIRTRIARRDIRTARTSRRAARQLRHFTIPTQVTFSEDPHHRYTIAGLTTVDRPGLLARVAQAFVECGVRLQNAKIATFGERVEDVFFITGQDNNPLSDAARLDALRAALIRHLDED